MTTATVPAVDTAPPELVTLPLTGIHPYPGNPRRIPDEAVAQVAESIRLYGYRQPIVVDTDHVVIVGHTRLRALSQLGYSHAQVWVASSLPAEKAAEFRLVDNRTSELGQWDHGNLLVELREWETGLVGTFFPDVQMEVASIREVLVTDADVEDATKRILDGVNRNQEAATQVECPACHDWFEVRLGGQPSTASAH